MRVGLFGSNSLLLVAGATALGCSPIQNSADSARVLHITDPHLFADVDSDLRGIVTYSSLQAVLSQVKSDNWPADMIAVTGDLSQDESVESYQRFKDLFAPLGTPVFCVPGNHDIRAIMKSQLSTAPFSYCGSMSLRDWLVIGIDSCIHGKAGGRVAEAEFQRVDSLLATTAAEHVLICLHHPPLPVGSKWLDSVGLENGSDFMEFVSQTGKVRAAIFGHVHQAFDTSRNGVRIFGTPSTCRQFKTDSDDFALDDNPPAYRRILLNPDGSVETELFWLRGNE